MRLRKLPLAPTINRLIVLIAIVAASIDCVSRQKWYELTAGLLGIVCLLLAWRFLSWLCPVKFCSVLDISLSLLACQGIVWGTIYQGYDHFWANDTLTHFFFGMILAYTGILISCKVMSNLQEQFSCPAGFTFLFGLSFAMLGKVVWELYEYAGDRIVAADMQRWQEGGMEALKDTMTDLAAGLFGALLVTIPIYLLLRKESQKFYFKHLRPYFKA